MSKYKGTKYKSLQHSPSFLSISLFLGVWFVKHQNQIVTQRLRLGFSAEAKGVRHSAPCEFQ